MDDYRRYVLPHSRSVIESLPAGRAGDPLRHGQPRSAAAVGRGVWKAKRGAVVGVDWRVRLDDAWRAIGYQKAIQGNLDPAVLLAEPVEIRRRVKEVLRQAAGRPGHIFNLGHGVLPETPPEHAIALVEAVHELSSRGK